MDMNIQINKIYVIKFHIHLNNVNHSFQAVLFLLLNATSVAILFKSFTPSLEITLELTFKSSVFLSFFITFNFYNCCNDHLIILLLPLE